MLEAAKTGPVTLEVASCARPAPLLNHRPLPPQKPSSSRRGERSPSRGRIGKAETAWAQIEAATWPVYARAQLQGVMRARCPCPAAGGRRRCRTHIYSGSPNCSSRVAAAATHRRRDGASGGVATPERPACSPTLTLLPAAANRPLLRCSAASQPRRPAPRRLPWRRLCECVCVYCVWGSAGNAGDAGTRGVH